MKKLNRSLLAEILNDRFREDVRTHHILGASVLIRQEGEEIFHAHFGWADIARTRPLDDRYLFRIASMTKVISAAAALIAVERGWLDLDAPVERYLPEFANLRHGSLNENGSIVREGKLKTPITVRRILSHNSLIDYGTLYAEQAKSFTAEQKATLAGSLDFYSRLAMEKEPGDMISYSGTVAFDLLGGILEKLSGKSYDAFLRDEILVPLKMNDTTFDPSPQEWSRMVEMHDKRDGVSVSGVTYPGCVFEFFPPSHPLAGAGLVSSLTDYDRFAQMLVNGGSLDGARILSEESVKIIGTVQFPDLEDTPNRWGLGARVRFRQTAEQVVTAGSFGWSGAYGTHFWVDPENRITVVFMKNSRHDGGVSLNAKTLERDVYRCI